MRVCLPLLLAVASTHAAVQTLLLFTKSAYVLAPLLTGTRAPDPSGRLCLAAAGLSDGENVMNDKCAYDRYRPGQAWQFDIASPDTYQPIRIRDDLCISATGRQIVTGMGCALTSCPSGAVPVAAALWKVLPPGTPLPSTSAPVANATTTNSTQGAPLSVSSTNSSSSGLTFVNMANTTLCLTADDISNQFFVRSCASIPNQAFGAIRLDPSIPPPE